MVVVYPVLGNAGDDHSVNLALGVFPLAGAASSGKSDGEPSMHDDYEIFCDAEHWLAAGVSCAPAFLIAAVMIASLIQPQFPG